MDAQQIKAFIDAMASSDLAEMEFSQDGWRLRLVRRQGAAEPSMPSRLPDLQRPSAAGAFVSPATDTAPAASNEVRAPLFGVVHLQPSPGQPPFVAVGVAVKAGQTLCVIEAMKVFNEVRAERDATVQAVLVSSGQEVDAGQCLLRLV
jgi:acetyl-CoA carboxylase biotin carboxyl carrier protein